MAILRRGAGYGLRFVQSQSIFRAVGRRAFRGIAISKASHADLEYVQLKLNPELSVEPPSPDPLVTALVAVWQGRVVGFVELIRHPPDDAPYVGFWLFGLKVLNPLCQGLGIGETLARRVIEIARSEGARELWLVVGEANCPAINLYQKLGFVRATVEGVEGQLLEEARISGRRRITMMKRLHE